MGRLLIMAPATVAGLTASRGTDVANLLSADPREAWRDSASGSAAFLHIDLGVVRPIDTVFLGHVEPLPAGATWTIRGGATQYGGPNFAASAPMRVLDPLAGRLPARSHALWHGPAVQARFIEIEVTQPAGAPPFAIGTLMVGQAFVAQFAQEWGGGRGVIDTGRATPLAAGGFAIVQGVRKGSYSWSFGDLSEAETDALYDIQLQCGETAPVLVVEDPARTPGQFHRIHYAKFVNLKPYKRRNPAQTRWELEVEQWA